MGRKTNGEIRKEVDELFSMYLYLDTYSTTELNPNKYFITYDNHYHEGKHAQTLHELLNGKYKKYPVSDKILHTVMGGANNGVEMTTPNRDAMLKKYSELKDKDDFNDPKKAPEYVKQIIEVFK